METLVKTLTYPIRFAYLHLAYSGYYDSYLPSMTVQEDNHQQALILLRAAGTVPKDTQESNVDACVQGSLTANIEKAAADLCGNEASLAKKILGEDGFLGAPAESVKASAACVVAIRSTLGRPLKPTDPDEWMKAALWGGSDSSADLTVIMGIISAAADILHHDELQDAVWQGLLGRSMTTTAVTTFEMHRVAREVCKGFGQQLRYSEPADIYANKWGLRKNVKAVNIEQALTELIKGTKVYIIPSNQESGRFFERLAAEGIAPCVEANVFRFVPATCTLVVDQAHHERWKATRLRSIFSNGIFSYCRQIYPRRRYIEKNFAMMAANASKIGLSDEFDFDNWDGPGRQGNRNLQEMQLDEEERQEVENVGGCLSKIIFAVMDSEGLRKCRCGRCKEAVIQYTRNGIQESCTAVKDLHKHVRKTISTLLYMTIESYWVETYAAGAKIYDWLIEELVLRGKRRWCKKVSLIDLFPIAGTFKDDQNSGDNEAFEERKPNITSNDIAMVYQKNIAIFRDVRWALAFCSGRKYVAINFVGNNSFDFSKPILSACYGQIEYKAGIVDSSPTKVDEANDQADCQLHVWYGNGEYRLVGMPESIINLGINNPETVGRKEEIQKNFYFGQSVCTHKRLSITATPIQWNEETEEGTGLIRAKGNPITRFAAMCVKRSKPVYIQTKECLRCSLRYAKANGCHVIVA